MQVKARRTLLITLTAATVAALTACGGGGGGGRSSTAPPPSASCSVADQKNWLRSYMQDAYFWAGVSPNPSPANYATLQEHFDAQLFTGSATFPKDRWSYISDTATYTQFFDEGKTLGYGLAVNGLEARLPLRIRYIDPRFPCGGCRPQTR